MFDPDNDDAHAPSEDPPMIVGKALQCFDHVTTWETLIYCIMV